MRSLLFFPLLFSFAGPAIADSEVFKIDVSAVSYRNYILSGTDRNGSVSGDDPTVTVNKGDTIIFDVDASRHPFYIKTEFSRGGGDQVTKGTISGTHGTQNGKLSWNTTGVSAGKYYYVCSPHASFGMGGTIIVE
ncbi:plastocyanin/azurin family copper-binding protein [Prochlorococcus sp. AH-716-A06]|nr:plastocyanin/azurin family copper-binding protein [Prochlorococcus sp. AH-716-A06]